MTQIKLFNQKTPYLEEFEKSVNAFLDENKDKIKVIDIKYTAVHPNLSNSIWVAWTAMVIYENLE